MSRVIDELDFIASRIIEDGGELPSFATLGVDAWYELITDMQTRTVYSNGGIPSVPSVEKVSAYLIAGPIDLKRSLNVPPDFVAIGRMTKNDIIVDDILLGDNDCTKDLDLSTDM